MASDSPAVARLQLSARLLQMRIAAGFTRAQVQGELLCSATLISRLETGQRTATFRDVRDLCRFYGTGEATTAALMDLAWTARRKDGLSTLSADRGGLYPDLEQAATAITVFAMDCVPALLQTPDYARSLTGAPDWEALPGRQQLLDREDPPECLVFLDEAVLHRRPAAGIMAAQLGHILALGERPKIRVRLVPFDAGAISALDSNFTILDFGDELPAMAFTGHLTGYAEHSGTVEHYREVVRTLQERALSPAVSAERITEMRDYWDRRAAG